MSFLPGRSYLSDQPVTAALLAELSVEPVDLLTIDLAETPVKELRTTLLQALEKPYGTNRLLWLRQASEASEIVQNTLLKLLEEPPTQLIIIVEASSTANFLPTVRSRLHSGKSERSSSVTEPALVGSYDQLATTLRAVKDRQELARLYAQELDYRRQTFLEKPSRSLAKQLKLLEQTLQRLRANANAKLVTDAFLLHWQAIQGSE